MKNLIGILVAVPSLVRLANRDAAINAFFRKLALVVGAAVLIGGCRSAPLYEVMAAPLPVAGKTMSMDDVAQAIVRAGLRAGWEIRPEKPGQLTGRYLRGSHNAVVDITHDTKTYTVKYRESTLGGGSGMVHPLYNTWVQNLNQSITGEFISLR